MRRRVTALSLVSISVIGVAACATPKTAAPSCTADQRTAIVAQAVPGASFVPCIADLPPGWSVEAFRVRRGAAFFTLESDREAQPVEIQFDAACDVSGATPIAPRDDGVRTYLRVDGIAPRFAGRYADVFPGGCVTSDFDFERGPHIALTDELRAAVDLFPRRELRRVLAEDLGVTLDP